VPPTASTSRSTARGAKRPPARDQERQRHGAREHAAETTRSGRNGLGDGLRDRGPHRHAACDRSAGVAIERTRHAARSPPTSRSAQRDGPRERHDVAVDAAVESRLAAQHQERAAQPRPGPGAPRRRAARATRPRAPSRRHLQRPPADDAVSSTPSSQPAAARRPRPAPAQQRAEARDRAPLTPPPAARPTATSSSRGEAEQRDRLHARRGARAGSRRRPPSATRARSTGRSPSRPRSPRPAPRAR
jgi:hypothetical protein